MKQIKVSATIEASPCGKYCDKKCNFFANGKVKKCKLFKVDLDKGNTTFISRCVDCVNAEQAAIIDAETKKAPPVKTK